MTTSKTTTGRVGEDRARATRNLAVALVDIYGHVTYQEIRRYIQGDDSYDDDIWAALDYLTDHGELQRLEYVAGDDDADGLIQVRYVKDHSNEGRNAA